MHAVITSAPAYRGHARRELDAALPPGAAVLALAAGTWLASAPGRFAELSSALRSAVFVRHACPADAEVPLPQGGQSAPWVARELLPAAVRLLPAGAGRRAVQAQVRILPGAPAWHPGSVAAALREGLAGLGLPAGGGRAEAVLSVVLAAGRAFAGYGPTAANLSPWPGGIARLRARPGEISRGARKIEEALELFGVHPEPGGRALDLGAAPGGWTRHLLDRGLAVTAVDTGQLDPRLAGVPDLTFIRGSALAVPVPAGPFDLLAADLSWDPLRAAACAARFRGALAPGAPGIFTIKFFGGDPPAVLASVRRRLEEGGFTVRAVRHLYHDRAEATALLHA